MSTAAPHPIEVTRRRRCRHDDRPRRAESGTGPRRPPRRRDGGRGPRTVRRGARGRDVGNVGRPRPRHRLRRRRGRARGGRRHAVPRLHLLLRAADAVPHGPGLARRGHGLLAGRRRRLRHHPGHHRHDLRGRAAARGPGRGVPRRRPDGRGGVHPLELQLRPPAHERRDPGHAPPARARVLRLAVRGNRPLALGRRRRRVPRPPHAHEARADARRAPRGRRVAGAPRPRGPARPPRRGARRRAGGRHPPPRLRHSPRVRLASGAPLREPVAAGRVLRRALGAPRGADAVHARERRRAPQVHGPLRDRVRAARRAGPRARPAALAAPADRGREHRRRPLRRRLHRQARRPPRRHLLHLGLDPARRARGRRRPPRPPPPALGRLDRDGAARAGGRGRARRARGDDLQRLRGERVDTSAGRVLRPVRGAPDHAPAPLRARPAADRLRPRRPLGLLHRRRERRAHAQRGACGVLDRPRPGRRADRSAGRGRPLPVDPRRDRCPHRPGRPDLRRADDDRPLPALGPPEPGRRHLDHAGDASERGRPARGDRPARQGGRARRS